MTTSADQLIGTEFIGYRIEALVGRGGMGVVYRAYDLRLKRNVALKLIAPELSEDETFRERFLSESELAASLDHPNVIPIYSAGEHEGQLYLAMRYVEGSDLKALLREQRALPPERALAILGQVAAALDSAHARGLVHRDVKPSNVLLDAEEHVYLADFGLSRRLADQGIPAPYALSLGTPAYVAPEQIEGEEVDGRADQYSLACLLHECLTGKPPYPRDSELAVLWAHLNDPPPSPPGLEHVTAKALAKEPEERYATCGELVAATREALGLTRARDRRALLLAATGAAILAGALATGLVLALGGGDQPKPSVAVSERTIVRIDPQTNKIVAAIEVGPGAKAVAVGGRTVWVYNVSEGTVSAIDSETNDVVRTTRISSSAITASYIFGGPVLAADDAGAWTVGSAGDKGVLTRISAVDAFKPEYAFDVDLDAVAVGHGAVWLVGGGEFAGGDDKTVVLRVSPSTGVVLEEIPLPGFANGIAVGEDAVWVMDSEAGDLVRIDPATSEVTGGADLGEEAAEPVAGYGFVWASTDRPGLLRVDPLTLRVKGAIRLPGEDARHVLSGAIGFPVDIALGEGSLWLKSFRSGTISRIDPRTGEILATIRPVPGPPPNESQLVPSSTIATGAGGVWVTVGKT